MTAERILRLAERSKAVDIYPELVVPQYDREYMLGSKLLCDAHRLAQYLAAQTVSIHPDANFVGLIKYDSSVRGDLFKRVGFQNYSALCNEFYKKPFENLATRDHQHANAKFGDVIKMGLTGLKKKIISFKLIHEDNKDKVEYLNALEIVLDGIVQWELKCANACETMAEMESSPERAAQLCEMGRVLRRVPLYPARTFREGIQCLYFCFQFVPDSIGTPDRYLYDLYRQDIESGALTRDNAKEMIQELYTMINGWTTPTNVWASDKGGESHFCIGGYTLDKEDGFNELSRLLLESLMEVPTYRPQISMRWTEKTPREALRYVLDCERKDTYKRVALISERRRVEALTELCGFAFEDAITYTMCGCNEPAVQGGINMAACNFNGVRCLDRLLYDCTGEVLQAKDFDAFYALFEREFARDVDRYIEINDGMNKYYTADVDILSSIFMDGSIEKAKSINAGGNRLGFNGVSLIGTGTVIDSLIVIKQFVYDDKLFTMEQIMNMLKVNWKGFDDVHRLIYRTAKYFGNDEPFSESVAQRYTDTIYRLFKDRRDQFGYPYLIGDLIGYCTHNAYFGRSMRATPDGRYDGENISFGAGQTGGRDRNGLTAMLNSVANMSKTHIMCGPTVTNVMLDESLIRDDVKFEKTVDLIEAYFRKGGLHIQLNYVSREELIAAQKEPEKHENLRVRVSGFSGYYTLLDPEHQQEIIERTHQEK